MKEENITCDCGTVFQWKPESDDDWVNSLIKPRSCPECTERIAAESHEKWRREREERIDSFVANALRAVMAETPTIFRATDTSHVRFNTAGWQSVQDWKPSFEKPWLGLIGVTGTCKSRIAYLLAAAEIERLARRVAEKDKSTAYPTFAFVASYEITDLAGKLNSSDFGHKDSARQALNRLRSVDLLLIDDLGKGRLSPVVASEMFAIIDHRYANALPMIWTSNSEPQDIVARLPDDMADPFAGRLHDSSRIIRFK